MQIDKRLDSHYSPGIDGLRAVAVLAVLLFHLDSSFLPAGFTGVDVFFLISGYVVSSSLFREPRSTFTKFALKFYARRIIRIYPALAVCLTFSALLQTLLVPESWLSTTSNKTGLLAFFGLSNFALVWFNDGYFAPRVEFNLFTHTWSLAIEEQFYLLYPIVFFVWLKWRGREGVLGVFANYFLVLLVAFSLALSFRETSVALDRAYYLLPSRFWELGSGAVLFKLHERGVLVARTSTASNVCIAFGLSLLGLGFVFSDPKAFPFPWALLPVVGAAITLTGVVSLDGSIGTLGTLLTNRLIVYVGKLSYSLYLWHWPVLALFRWTVGLEAPFALISAIVLTVLMSVFSYHLVETPIRKLNVTSLGSYWYVVSRGSTIIVLCCIFTALVFKAQPLLSLSVTKDRKTWYSSASPPTTNADANRTSPFQGRKIFVLGDSHAKAYSTMLSLLTEDYGIEVHYYSMGGCNVANLIDSPNGACNIFIERSISDIKKRASPQDIVFLAALRMNRLGDQWKSFDEAAVVSKQDSQIANAKRAIALEEANRLIASLASANLAIVVDAPKPIFKSPPFRCSDWFNLHNPICKSGLTMDRSFLLEYRKPVMDSIMTLASKHANLVVWDTLPTLCPSATCNAFDGDKPLFFDGDHLSAHGNRVLYRPFLSMLALIWAK